MCIRDRNNIVYDPNQFDDNDNFLKTAKKALTAKYFLTSVNAITEDGIDVYKRQLCIWVYACL